MKNESKKAHLVYLTGLSMDKKRLNYITENINRDIDFTYWFDKTKNSIIESLEKDTLLIVNELDKDINIIKVMINTIMKNKFPNNYNEVKKYVTPILSDILDAKNSEGIFSFFKNKSYSLEEFFKDISRKIDTYHNGDFFALYISHQSDSIGVAPLSKLSASENLTLLNSYCDRPYYANEYINHIVLKIDKKTIKAKYHKHFKDFVESNFDIHFLDTFLSKLVGDSHSNGYSYFDMVNTGEKQNNLKDIQASLSERNFYGISLLNQFFYNLEKLLIDSSLSININSDDETKKEFLKELILSSTNPKNIIFSEYGQIQAKIYFSDGLELSDKENSKDLNFSSFTNWNEIKRKDMGLQTASDDNIDASYFYEEEESFFIKIPIKMTFSLPINKNGVVDSSLFIPYGLDSDNHKIVDIITVGGAEHNRALAHLINKHREEYKEERIFGFMDNKYDLGKKVKDMRNTKYEHSFLMGLNQPVSGYNAIFSTRVDDDKGESISWNTKLLGYRLKDGDSKVYNILSIYGFSALASVFGMHYIVSEIDNKAKELKITDKGIFDKYYLNALKPRMSKEEMNNKQNHINKGLSALILYPKTSNDKMEKQFNYKVPLYVFNNNINLYKKTFLLGDDDESIYSVVKIGRNTENLM